MDDKETVIRKGKQAALLQTDPILTECLERIKTKQVQNIVGSSPEKSDQRERAYYLLKAVEELQIELNSVVSNGRFEEARLRK